MRPSSLFQPSQSQCERPPPHLVVAAACHGVFKHKQACLPPLMLSPWLYKDCHFCPFYVHLDHCMAILQRLLQCDNLYIISFPLLHPSAECSACEQGALPGSHGFQSRQPSCLGTRHLRRPSSRSCCQRPGCSKQIRTTPKIFMRYRSVSPRKSAPSARNPAHS